MPAYVSLLTALGWSLLESIWQMAVLWTVYYLLAAGNKRISAAGKHNLVLLLVFFSAEWFVYSFFHLLKEPMDLTVSGYISVSSEANQWIPYLSGLYLLILAGRFLQYGFLHVKGHINKSSGLVSPIIQSFADRYIRILGITKRVTVYLSEMSETAETSGFLKPLILLPFSMLTRLSPAQLEAILVHELYHIRRNDYLINIGMTCFRSIFFFNPFARLFYKALERERELACDDGVLELGYEPAVYAEALFSLEKYRQVNSGFSLAADGNRPWLLMERIRRVLGEPALREKRFSPMFLSGLAAAFVFFGLQLTALPGGRSTVAVAHEPIVPVHFEIAEEKNIVPVSEITYRSLHILPVSSSAQRQSAKKTGVKERQAIGISAEPSAEETVLPDQAFYAENSMVRNYSNESEAGPVTDAVAVFPGTPYVPSASLSYEAFPESSAEDSARHLLEENCLKDVMTATRLNSVIVLKKLQSEMENGNRQLKVMELKNKNLILLDQENIRPILKKLHQDMRDRKKEIEKMRIRLQVSPAEIIHI
jgi:Zn-dependent protease with chaperone function